MSSSQLTNSYFSEGWPNHQPVTNKHYKHLRGLHLNRSLPHRVFVHLGEPHRPRSHGGCRGHTGDLEALCGVLCQQGWAGFHRGSHSGWATGWWRRYPTLAQGYGSVMLRWRSGFFHHVEERDILHHVYLQSWAISHSCHSYVFHQRRVSFWSFLCTRLDCSRKALMFVRIFGDWMSKHQLSQYKIPWFLLVFEGVEGHPALHFFSRW